MQSGAARKAAMIVAVLMGALVFCASSFLPAEPFAFGGQANASSGLPRQAASGAYRPVLVQATPSTTVAVDATSAPSAEAGQAEVPSTDAVSSASVEESPKDTAYCLKCHGPFEKLIDTTKDYVSQFDEHINPHQFVPHDSKSVPECAQCHEAHPIPYKAESAPASPELTYCYSCHHTQTFETCSQCHNE
jgi:hypothetical protein